MNREQKVDFLIGLANGTRSVNELIIEEPTVDLELLSDAEDFLIVSPRKNHGVFVTNLIGPPEQMISDSLSDYSDRSHIEKEFRKGIIGGVTIDKIHYKEGKRQHKTHFCYHGCQRTISFFPDQVQAENLIVMNYKELEGFFESNIDELIIKAIATGVCYETDEEDLSYLKY